MIWLFAAVFLLVLLGIAGIEALHLHTLREHLSVMTVLHAEIAELHDDLDKLYSKFDGGSIPK